MKGFLKVATALVLCFGLVRMYSVYKAQAAPILPGVLIGEFDFREAGSPQEVAQTLRDRFEQPVLVTFHQAREAMSAEEVGLQVDVDRILAEAGTYRQGGFFLRNSVRALLGLPMEKHTVPLYFWFDRDQARRRLAQFNAEFQSQPQSYYLRPLDQGWVMSQVDAALTPTELGFLYYPYPDWTWQPGAPGLQVDIEQSLEGIAGAFMGTGKREWALDVREVPGPDPELGLLQKTLDAYTADFLGFAAFYLQDLVTGEVAEFDSAVAFSGMSNLKLLIVMAVMRDIDGITSAPDLGQWIDLALGDSNNAAANLLLQSLGDGNVVRGAAKVTAFGRQLGLQNTFILTGYDDPSPVVPPVTPANSQEWDTRPDSHLQTTAADMGRVLAGIYECTQGHGVFLEIFPGEITPAECRSILFYLTHNDFQEMIWGGLPEPTERTVLHKHGFSFEQHGDVALVWGPAGPYVLSFFLYRPVWLDWAIGNGTMYNVSRITWRYFEAVAQRTHRTAYPPPHFAAPDGYIPQPQAS